MILQRKVKFAECTCEIELDKYANGQIHIQLIDSLDGLRVTTVTKFEPKYITPDDRYILVKNYAENKGILEALEKENIVKRTGIKFQVGFAELDEAVLLQ